MFFFSYYAFLNFFYYSDYPFLALSLAKQYGTDHGIWSPFFSAFLFPLFRLFIFCNQTAPKNVLPSLPLILDSISPSLRSQPAHKSTAKHNPSLVSRRLSKRRHKGEKQVRR